MEDKREKDKKAKWGRGDADLDISFEKDPVPRSCELLTGYLLWRSHM